MVAALDRQLKQAEKAAAKSAAAQKKVAREMVTPPPNVVAMSLQP